MATLTPKTAKWIEGKTVRHVRIETHKGADCANANVHHTRYIEFTDGTYIFFAVGELEDDYGIETVYHNPM